MSQTIYTCFQTAIQIFVSTMVFINQYQIQEYRDKRAKLLTDDRQNNLCVPPTLVLCNNSGSGKLSKSMNLINWPCVFFSFYQCNGKEIRTPLHKKSIALITLKFLCWSHITGRSFKLKCLWQWIFSQNICLGMNRPLAYNEHNSHYSCNMLKPLIALTNSSQHAESK